MEDEEDERDWNGEYLACLCCARRTTTERLEREIRLYNLHRQFEAYAQEKIEEMLRSDRPIQSTAALNVSTCLDYEHHTVGRQYVLEITKCMRLVAEYCLAEEDPGFFCPLMAAFDIGSTKVVVQPVLRGAAEVEGNSAYVREMTPMLRKFAETMKVPHCPEPLKFLGHIECRMAMGRFWLVSASYLFPPVQRRKTAVRIPWNICEPCTRYELNGDVLQFFERRSFGERATDISFLRKEEHPGIGTVFTMEDAREKNERVARFLGTRCGDTILCDDSMVLVTMRPELFRDREVIHVTEDEVAAIRSARQGLQVLEKLPEQIESILEHYNECVIENATRECKRSIETFEQFDHFLHASGVNMRTIAPMYRAIFPYAKPFLCTEMVARVIKTVFFLTLKNVHKMNIPMFIVNFFNSIFGYNLSQFFWTHELPVFLEIKFWGNPFHGMDLRSEVIQFSLFERVCELTGVRFKRGAIKRLFDFPNSFSNDAVVFPADLAEPCMEIRKTSFFACDIKKSVMEEIESQEAQMQNSVESLHDVQAQSAFQAIHLLTWHKRIEEIFGVDSKEAIHSYFDLAEQHMKYSNMQMALEAAITGHCYCEDLFGPYSTHVVRSTLLVGTIFEKMGNLSDAVKFFKATLVLLQKNYRTHPLIGVVMSKLFSCSATQSRPEDMRDRGKLLERNSSLTKEDAKKCLLDSFRILADIYGPGDEAYLMFALMAFKQGNHQFVQNLRQYFQMDTSRTKEFLASARDLWPQEPREFIEQQQTGQPWAEFSVPQYPPQNMYPYGSYGM